MIIIKNNWFQVEQNTQLIDIKMLESLYVILSAKCKEIDNSGTYMKQEF